MKTGYGKSTALRRGIIGLTVGALLAASGTAGSAEWVVRAGAHTVVPKSNNHDVVNVDSGKSFTFNISYLWSERFGVELLAALPFSHDINLNSGAAKVAETRQLPPTLSMQYHFAPQARFRPYVGAGLNATIFFDEKTRGALEGSHLSLRRSFGLAAQVGADYAISDLWSLNFDARWMDIDTKATLSGTDLGSVRIDPYAVGISIARRFGSR